MPRVVDGDALRIRKSGGAAGPVPGSSGEDTRRTGKRGHAPSRRDLSYRTVERIRDVNIAGPVNRHGLRIRKLGRCPRVIYEATCSHRACQGTHQAAGSDLADRLIGCVCDVNIPQRVDCQPAGGIKLSGCTLPITGATGHRACERGDHAGRADFSNYVVPAIRNVNVIRAIDGQTVGVVEARCSACAIGGSWVPAKTDPGGDDPGRTDLADRAIAQVSHVDGAGAVHRHGGRGAKFGRAARPIIRAELPHRAGQRGNNAGWGDLAHRVIAAISHVNVAQGIDRNTLGIVKPRGASGSVGRPGSRPTHQGREGVRRRVGKLGPKQVQRAKRRDEQHHQLHNTFKANVMGNTETCTDRAG